MKYVPTESDSITTEPSPVNEDVILMSLRSRWREAVVRWEHKLLANSYKGNPNRKAIADFQSWDDLITQIFRKSRKMPYSPNTIG